MAQERKPTVNPDIKLYDYQTKEIDLHIHFFDESRFIPLSDDVLVTTNAYTGTKIFDTTNNQLKHSMYKIGSRLVYFDVDHLLINDQSTLLKWNIKTGETEEIVRIGDWSPHSMVLLPNGLLAVSGSNIFWIYDLEKKQQVGYCCGEDQTKRLLLSHDKNELYVFEEIKGSSFHNICVYDLKTGKYNKKISNLPVIADNAIVLANNQIVIHSGDFYHREDMLILDIKSGKVLHTLKTPGASATALIELPMNILAVGVADINNNGPAALIFYDIKTRKKISELKFHKVSEKQLGNISYIRKLVFNPANNHLICYESENKKLYIHDLDIGLGKILEKQYGECFDVVGKPKKIVMEYLGWMTPRKEIKPEATINSAILEPSSAAETVKPLKK